MYSRIFYFNTYKGIGKNIRPNAIIISCFIFLPNLCSRYCTNILTAYYNITYLLY